MTRKRRRQQKGFPWPILVFGGVLLIAAAFLLANRGGGSGGGGAPLAAVEPAKIDYGYVQFGNTESFKIKVTNNGGGVLKFKDQPYIEVLEGC